MYFARHLLRAAFALASALPWVPLAAVPPSLNPVTATFHSLDGFHSDGANWGVAGGIEGDPRVEKVLTPALGTGVLLNTARGSEGSHLFSTWAHGDLELELEFLVPVGSNSGVYLQGRYEVQIYDSWGVLEPKVADAGAIYERWDSSRPRGQHGFEGHPPRLGVSRAPGLWQQLRINFRAPRFDESGLKTAHARFVRIEHNGVLVHENVEVTGPTRSSAFEDEKPSGPLMLQGDHGPVAFRNFRYAMPHETTPSAPDPPRSFARAANEIQVEPGRVRVQPTLYTFENGRRVHGLAVGFEARRNFIYDPAHGCLLGIWTGALVDRTDRTSEHGEQLARSMGAVIEFDGRPSLAGLDSPASPWPPAGRTLLEPRGYTLEAGGLPVFHYTWGSARVSDRIALRADRHGFERTVTISGELPVGQPYLLLAEDTEIASRPGGYVVGPGRYYVDLDEEAQPSIPVLRRESDRMQLIVPLGAHSGERSYRYSLVW